MMAMGKYWKELRLIMRRVGVLLIVSEKDGGSGDDDDEDDYDDGKRCHACAAFVRSPCTLDAATAATAAAAFFHDIADAATAVAASVSRGTTSPAARRMLRNEISRPTERERGREA